MVDRAERWDRRKFLRDAAFAATAGAAGLRPQRVLAEPPPETTTLRLVHTPALCFAPEYVAEEILPAEGFVDVRYLKLDLGDPLKRAMLAGEVDIMVSTIPLGVLWADAGVPFTFLSGVHVGCYELFGTDRIRAIHDLKGKTVAVPVLGAGAHIFLLTMLAAMGMEPRRDVTFVAYPPAEAMERLAAGTVDAYMAFPPEPQELRARKIGHVVINTILDRPWSQYFCCMVVANRTFVRTRPVATKRALRAILKANQVCTLEPDRAARLLVDKGYTTHYGYAQQAMREMRYANWRDFDAEDSVRFQALRLRELGMIKSSPQKIIAQNTDWRFLNELKKELKG